MPQPVRNQTAAATTQPSSFVSLLSGWIQQGMESFFATQKILMDVATRQNANAVKAFRDSLADPKHSPTAILKELLVEGTANFIEAQRVLLDLGQKENEILLHGIKERAGGNAAVVAMSDIVRRSVDTFLDMQQEFLTIASRQAQALMEPQKPGDRNRMLDAARQGMEKFVHAQKEFLNVIAEETEKMTSGKGVRTHKEAKPTPIPKIAHQSAMAMVDAQKKLLDLAAQQMNVNIQLASRTGDLMAPLRVPLAQITGEGVRNFVSAEKALIDNMVKGRGNAQPVEKRRKPAKKTARTRHMKTVAATA